MKQQPTQPASTWTPEHDDALGKLFKATGSDVEGWCRIQVRMIKQALTPTQIDEYRRELVASGEQC